MKVLVRKEEGYGLAIEGIGYSYGIEDIARLNGVAKRLAPKNGGHNKFLESIQVWIEITAARYWWQEFDTYRVGTTKQSESTIHTICRTKLSQEDFEHSILPATIDYLNDLIGWYNNEDDKSDKDRFFELIKANLPEGYLQKRLVCTNYKVLKNMVAQRKNHRLQEWHTFIAAMQDQLDWPDFIGLEED